MPSLLSDTVPVSHKLHLFTIESAAQFAKTLKRCNEWLKLGCIIPSASPYGHPVLFAEKKGVGDICLCINYYALNAKTATDAWPLP